MFGMGTGVTLVVCSPANLALAMNSFAHSAMIFFLQAALFVKQTAHADRSQLNRLGARTDVYGALVFLENYLACVENLSGGSLHCAE